MKNKDHKIIKKRFKIIGVSKHVNWNDDMDKIIQQSQAEISKVISTISSVINPKMRIKYFYSESGIDKGFNYMEAVEVEDFNFIPTGFISKELPESSYAVFNEKNGEEGTMGEYARKTWLTNSGYKENHSICGDLEVSFVDNTKDHEFWLPIK